MNDIGKVCLNFLSIKQNICYNKFVVKYKVWEVLYILRLLNLQRLELKKENFEYLEASCTSCGASSCNGPDPSN